MFWWCSVREPPFGGREAGHTTTKLKEAEGASEGTTGKTMRRKMGDTPESINVVKLLPERYIKTVPGREGRRVESGRRGSERTRRTCRTHEEQKQKKEAR